MTTPVLKGEAARVAITVEENTRFRRVVHNLADDATDQNGEHEPFEDGTKGYFTAKDKVDGTTLFTLGPEDEDGFDGICTVDCPAGLISLDLPVEGTVGWGLNGPRYTGWFNLVLYIEGDPDQAKRYLEGELPLSLSGSDYPPVTP